MIKAATCATDKQKNTIMTEKQKIRLLNVVIILLLTSCTLCLTVCMFGPKGSHQGLLSLALGCSALSNPLVLIRTRIVKRQGKQ